MATTLSTASLLAPAGSKNGFGVLSLNAANTFTGAFIIGQGSIKVGDPNALKSNTVFLQATGNNMSFGGLSSVTLGSLAGNFGSTITLSNDNSDPVAMTIGGNNASMVGRL